MLWLVEDYERWGYSLNVVRAATAEEAYRLVNPHDERDMKLLERVHIWPLAVDGEPAILWCRDESPDTPNRGD
jgi:hypothetical protein